MDKSGRNAHTPLDILLVESDETAREAMLREIPQGTSFIAVESAAQADQLLAHTAVRLLVCADDLPDESGLMYLARTREQWPGMRRILLASALDPHLFFHAMQEVRLFRYLDKPLQPGVLARAIHQCRPITPSAPQTSAPAPAPPAAAASTVHTGIAGGMLIGLLVCAVTLGPLTLFLAAYFLKTLAGIDIFPGTHLKELFP